MRAVHASGTHRRRRRPFPPLYACRAGRHRRDVDRRRPGGAADRHLRRRQGRSRDDGRLRGFHGKKRRRSSPGTAAASTCPVLALRALRFGLDFRWYYRGEGYRYRFTEGGHLDLCDVISDYGAARMTSLDGARGRWHRPARTASTAARSKALFHAGQIEALRQYCLSDVAQTRRSSSALPARLRRSRSRRLPSGRHRMLAALETDGASAACSTVSTGAASC